MKIIRDPKGRLVALLMKLVAAYYWEIRLLLLFAEEIRTLLFAAEITRLLFPPKISLFAAEISLFVEEISLFAEEIKANFCYKRRSIRSIRTMPN